MGKYILLFALFLASYFLANSQTINRNNANDVAFKTNNDFSIYPNPANQIATIKFNSTGSDFYEITITNVVGAEIKKVKIESILNELKIDVSSFNNGVYICCLKNDKKVLSLKKLIVKH